MKTSIPRMINGRAFSVSLLLVFFLLLGPIHRTAAADKPIPPEQPAGEAIVALVEGMVSLLDKNGKPVQPLSLRDRCRPGDRIRTGHKARLSLNLQDGTHVRFSEITTFELVSLRATEIPKQRNIQVRLLSGDAWVNAAMPYTGKGTVSIIVPKAVIQTTQSICRLTVFSDNSSLVKVYRGRIEVEPIQAPATNGASDTSDRSKKDKSAWNYLLQTMQQLYIRPDGSTTNPFRFMFKVDENKWVLWNRELDEKIGTPGE